MAPHLKLELTPLKSTPILSRHSMSNTLPFLKKRPRRNRKSGAIRELVQENRLSTHDFIAPLFILEGQKVRQEIPSMPNIFRYSIDQLLVECTRLQDLGIQAIALFPNIAEELKDSKATEASNQQGLYARAILEVKNAFPNLVIFSDVALDPYSSDGHDGLVNELGEIDNDQTLPILANMALMHAKAGADFVAPSDMMDGRIAYLRQSLDKAGFNNVGILSYTAKYASAMYAPFRDALGSAPKKGDKKTYQMNPANVKEAMLEAQLDIDEGADMLMVKPGIFYLDVLKEMVGLSPIPVAVYNVSGEYAMLNAAQQKGWLDYESAVCEALIAFKRAGASLILSYHAAEFAEWLKA